MKQIVDIHHHIDTLQNFVLLRSKLQDHIYKLNDHITEDTQTILSVPVYAQAWQSYRDLISIIKNLKSRIDQTGSQVKLITTKSDLEGDYKLGIILHIESARLIKSPSEQLPELFDLGVRGIIPLHFIDNHLGQSYDDPRRRLGLRKKDTGLTDHGLKFIEHMNQHGMWVDVSHSTDQTGEDILNTANEVMASHIAIRDLTPKLRNKTIEFYKKLAEKKGIFGLQPWQHLIGNSEDAYFKHMNKAIEQGLEKSICIGTDLGAPIKTHHSIKSLYDCASVAEQFEQAELIVSKNALTFFKRALPN
jgi:membrane dipeptidase